VIRIDLPIKTVAGLNAREHYRARAARVKSERHAACVTVKVTKRPFPCVVTMTRLSPGTLDSDNLQGSFKAIRDGIADAYQLPDNDPRSTFHMELRAGEVQARDVWGAD